MLNLSKLNYALLTGALCALPSAAFSAAVEVPASADAGRVQKNKGIMRPVEQDAQEKQDYKISHSADMPDGAKGIILTPSNFKVSGVTVFTDEEIAAIYKPYLNREITLDVLWLIAEEITQLYNKNGYFLSYAYIPQQEVDGGVLNITVSEGYINNVVIEGELSDSYLLNDAAERLKEKKPISSKDLEREVLLINDLAGYSFRTILEPDEQSGAITLRLIPSEDKDNFRVSFDNYGSRYLGPYGYSAIAQMSILPMQKTSFTFAGVTQADEMRYYSVSHEIPLTTALSFEIYGGNVFARPGYSLRQFEVESQSANLGATLKYDAIRQRDQNLEIKLAVDGKNSNTNVLQAPQTRDRVRAARLGFSYDNFDSWNGYNTVTAAFSHGLDIINASQPGELTLSRGEAKPDFKKIEFYYSRLQPLAENLAMFFATTGQYSNEPLFSSEEFGYGGIDFGRAYDPSEITGDSGLAGSLELRYYTTSFAETTTIPYAFYDIGKVWNRDTDTPHISAASTGFGVRLANYGVESNFSVAWPLTKQIDAPMSSHDKGPRFLFQVGYGF